MSVLASPDVAPVDAAGHPPLVRVGPRLSSHDRGWLVRRALVASEGVALVAAFLCASALSLGPGALGAGELWREVAFILLGLPIWVVASKLVGLYDRDIRFAGYSTSDDVGAVFGVATLGTLVALFVSHLLGAEPAWGRIGLSWLLVVPFVLVGHALARALVRRRPGFPQNAVVVGTGAVGRTVALKFGRHPETSVNVIGFVDQTGQGLPLGPDGPPIIGTPRDLPAFVDRYDVQRVIFAFAAERHDDTLNLIRELRELGVIVDIVPRLFDLIGPGTGVHDVEGMPLIGLDTLRLSRSSLVVKRAVDVLLASLLLLLLAPVFAAIALAIVLDSRGPVLFCQTRIGLRNRPFRLVKFRTMVRNADSMKHELSHLNRHVLEDGGDPRMFKIRNDPRVTRVGRVLRKYFVDELPQLLNVIHGEMSLIGPRPLIPEEAAFVDDWGHRRLDLKPGMTGVWQVLGRSSISFEEMVKLDYLYVTTWSLGHDLRLLLRTIPLVLRGEAPV
ncbi:MAG TPA: sugar transferase [Gaiellaceae bacterium]|nr:sugar transferase [Gaiellaceae bacterium]